MNYEGDKERFTLWVNPRLDTAPEESAGFSFISTKSDFSNWSQLNEIRLAAGFTSAAGPSSAWQVDEIRIGDTREDVCPLVPFRITQVVRLPSGAVQVTWFAPPGCTDTVEWSSDLIHWQPYPASTRTNPPASVTALWETPVSSETALFLRIRRAP